MRIPEVPKGWDRCHAYNEKKRRFCRQTIRPLSSNNNNTAIYCGNHFHLYETQSGCIVINDEEQKKKIKRKRIPCPLDPSHWIYQSNLQKHLLICPKRTQQTMEQKQPYYRHNINKGGYPNHNNTDKQQQVKQILSREKAKELALKILQLYNDLFQSNNSNNDCKKEKCSNESSLLFEEYYQRIPTHDYYQQESKLGLNTKLLESYRIKSGGPKHLHQIGSMVGHVRSTITLPTSKGDETPPNTIILEMGAGRGMTGLITAGVTAATTTTKTKVPFVMIERAGSRSKADTTIRRNNTKNTNSKSNNDSYMKFENVEMTRIKCDLAHVHVPTVMDPILKQYSESSSPDHRPIVVVAKHLCGVGTDFALKSIAPYKQNIRGCIFATCCHGVCNWTDYVGKQYLQTIFQQKFQDDTLFGPNEFHLMKKWTSASVLSIPNKVDETNSQTKTNHEVMEQENHNHHSTNNDNDDDATTTTTTTGLENTNTITSIVEELQLKCGVQGLGRACQRLIDYGRLEYIKHQLFPTSTDAQLCHYVDSDITPQNALLKAFHHSK